MNGYQEGDQNNVTQVTYTLGPALYGDLVSQRHSGATSWYHFDGLGSTDRLSNVSGTVTDSYIYQAFGTVQATIGTTTNSFKYIGRQGYYVDPDLTALSVRRRPYGPVTARWENRDPLWFWAGDSNLYRYVKNHPTGQADPSGLQVERNYGIDWAKPVRTNQKWFGVPMWKGKTKKGFEIKVLPFQDFNCYVYALGGEKATVRERNPASGINENWDVIILGIWMGELLTKSGEWKEQPIQDVQPGDLIVYKASADGSVPGHRKDEPAHAALVKTFKLIRVWGLDVPDPDKSTFESKDAPNKPLFVNTTLRDLDRKFLKGTYSEYWHYKK
jgi:RHS repeat-associated protein